jgi:hydrogenase maturation protease
VIVLEAVLDDLVPAELDVHGMHPVAVLGTVRALGGQLPPTYVVGCPAESVREGIGLSPAVAAAVPAAIDAVLALLGRPPLAGIGAGGSPGSGRS